MSQLTWIGNHSTVLKKGAQDVHVGTQNEFQHLTLGKCRGEMGWKHTKDESKDSDFN